MHILWINEVAAMTGGCERYIVESVNYLKTVGFKSSLLYAVDGGCDPEFTGVFDAAFPMVDIAAQIEALAPDVIYIHRLANLESLQAVANCGVPVARFFHDHKLFCLREHKYTAIGQHTCTQRIGLGCYTCLGFVARTPGFPGIGLRTLSRLEKEQKINRTFDAFVVASEYMRGEIAQHGFDASRVHVNPLYAEPIQADASIQREPDLVVFAGQLTTGKGVDTLLTALAMCKSNARLIIGGTGKFADEYKQLAEKLGVSERVTFAGRLSSQQLAALYQRAACVAVPSRAPETFGLIGPEAMRFGTPVIATKVGGMNEWLVDQQTGLAVSPNSPHELAGAIDRMLLEPGLREKLGSTALEKYESDFRPERHRRRLVNMLCALASRGVNK
jgi:glycosyltransferase involved in cell wall biosynthesis